jgi:Flp pilus assembly pilin Flp
MINAMKKFLAEEEGISSVEYAILLAFVATALVVSIQGLRNAVAAAFDAAKTVLTTNAPS